MSKERFKEEMVFHKPIALVLGGERFIVPPPSAMVFFQAAETTHDEGFPLTLRAPELDRWALRVGERVLTVTRRATGLDHSHIHRTVPGDEFTIELAAEHTRVRRDFRKALWPTVA